jgi:hypothetical protein
MQFIKLHSLVHIRTVSVCVTTLNIIDLDDTGEAAEEKMKVDDGCVAFRSPPGPRRRRRTLNHTFHLYITYRSTNVRENEVGLAGLQSERCTSCKGVFLFRSREAHARPRPNELIPAEK